MNSASLLRLRLNRAVRAAIGSGLLACGIAQLPAQQGMVATGTTSQTAPQKIEVTVTADIADQLASVGRHSFSSTEIDRQKTGDINLNALTRTLPNVQFDNSYGDATVDGMLNIRPENISISGGRFYENNFIVNGISTSSVLDVSNPSNMHNYGSVVGHPQTAYVNPAHVGEMTVYESNVPARYSGFTGGVVDVTLKRPTGKFGGEAGVLYDYDGSAWYIASGTGTLPPKPDYRNTEWDAQVNLPSMGKLNVLLAWSREDVRLSNTKRQIQYEGGPTVSESESSNYRLAADYVFSNTDKLEFDSIYAPYEQMNHEQSVRTQDGDSWINKVTWKHIGSRSKLEASVGYQQADNDRDQDESIMIFKNFASAPLWGNSTTSIRGGYGKLISEQNTLSANIEYTLKITDTLKLNSGFAYRNIEARESRPETNYQYTNTLTATDPLVVSASGSDDPTVIEGNQALNRRTVYLAYDSTVRLSEAGLWAELADSGKWGSVGWAWRAGGRYEYDDFLKNNNLAPRTTAMIKPLSWLSFHAGYNRYYSNTMLTYKLMEGRPNWLMQSRTYQNEGGKHVYYNDESSKGWQNLSVTAPYYRRQGDVKTPYADSYTAGFVVYAGVAGEVRINGQIRHERDAFAAAPVNDSDKRPDGSTWNYRLLTNNAWIDYQSLVIEWFKTWRNNTFKLNATWSTRDSSVNDTYYDSEETEDWWTTMVYYNGNIQTRKSVSQKSDNYARPLVVNGVWSSNWFKDRLVADVKLKWTNSYGDVTTDGTYTDATGRYTKYRDYEVDDLWDVDVNAAFAVLKTRYGSLWLETRVENLFNQSPYQSQLIPTSTYYIKGRIIRVGMRYVF